MEAQQCPEHQQGALCPCSVPASPQTGDELQLPWLGLESLQVTDPACEVIHSGACLSMTM